MAGRRQVLLDRDGTIIVERNYLADPAGVELLPGAAEGLRRMAGAGLGLAVVTNQSGVARGYFDLAAVGRVNDRLRALLAAEGVALDRFYVCPHGPDDGCDCRKPLPGLILEAAAELGFAPSDAFLIGDKEADIAAGQAAGAATILVRTGYGREAEGRCVPDAVADDLADAARWIEARVTAAA